MTNFKGTKGEWLKYRKTDQHNVEEIRTIKGESICLISNNSESEYNAKLIAYAPEMLEILNNILEDGKRGIYLFKEDLNNIEELIKKATE